MPELAEVKIQVDGLIKEFFGQSLHNMEAIGGRFLKNKNSIFGSNLPLHGAQFNAKGKFIYWSFEKNKLPQFSQTNYDGKTHFFITLGMTGSFSRQQNKHSAVKFKFDSEDLFFNDIRHFGTIKTDQSTDALNKKLKSLGWDPIISPFIPDDILPKLRKKNNKFIHEVLLDQSIFCGMGNYLRNEVLYTSKISPWQNISSLSNEELINICQNYIDITEAAYQAGGATLSTYSDFYGKAGNYSNQFKVYGRKFDDFGNVVIKQAGVDGRTLHWVQEEQI